MTTIRSLECFDQRRIDGNVTFQAPRGSIGLLHQHFLVDSIVGLAPRSLRAGAPLDGGAPSGRLAGYEEAR